MTDCIFVADVGGTNARFALVGRGEDGRPAIRGIAKLRAADYPTFGQCALAWLKTLDAGLRPKAATLAVAGPILGTTVALTNRAWTFEIPDLQAELGLDRLHVINDFAAIAYSLPLIAREHMYALPGPAWPAAGLPEIVGLLGPGTGLGVAISLSAGRSRAVIATEGGHCGFAPADDVEIEVLRLLAAKFGRVSAERLISGPGLKNIYQALGTIRAMDIVEREPAGIVEAANQGDPLARLAVERFCLVLATLAGDLALAQGALAIAIAGGIPPKILPYLATEAVRERFNAKGRRRDMMEVTPLAVITDPEPGLLGAAAHLAAAHWPVFAPGHSSLGGKRLDGGF